MPTSSDSAGTPRTSSSTTFCCLALPPLTSQRHTLAPPSPKPHIRSPPSSLPASLCRSCQVCHPTHTRAQRDIPPRHSSARGFCIKLNPRIRTNGRIYCDMRATPLLQLQWQQRRQQLPRGPGCTRHTHTPPRQHAARRRSRISRLRRRCNSSCNSTPRCLRKVVLASVAPPESSRLLHAVHTHTHTHTHTYTYI